MYYEKREYNCKYVTISSVFILYEMKMENKTKNHLLFFLSNWEFFVWKLGKNILFDMGNGAEIRPPNRVIESPVI